MRVNHSHTPLWIFGTRRAAVKSLEICDRFIIFRPTFLGRFFLHIFAPPFHAPPNYNWATMNEDEFYLHLRQLLQNTKVHGLERSDNFDCLSALGK